MADPQIETPAQTPAPAAVVDTLDAFRATEEARPNLDAASPASAAPAPPIDAMTPTAPAPAAQAATAAAEANSVIPDAEVSEAARTLRKNRVEERKARIQGEINELVAQRNRIRDELARAPRVPPSAVADVKPSTERPAGDPSDPEPTLASFQAAHPDHPDPYAGVIEARLDWKLRQRDRQVDATRQRQQADDRFTRDLSTFDTRAAALRASHSDFDAIVSDLPMTPLVVEILGAEHGPQLAYHLAKHPERHRELEAMPLPRALLAVGAITAQFAAAPVETAAPVSHAPHPHTPTGAAASLAGKRVSDVGSLDEFRAFEDAIMTGRR